MEPKKNYKENKGNKYAHNQDYAKEVIEKNHEHNPYPVQQDLGTQRR